MILLFLSLVRGYYDDDICSIFDYDMLECLGYGGCEYCYETGQCYPMYNYDGTYSKKCSLSNSIVGKNRKLNKCFTLLSDDGCQKCVSNDLSIKCGWIDSLGVCAEGDENGPYGIKCQASDWLFNTTRCKRSTCANARSRNECISPCKWNKKNKVCYRPRKMLKNALDEEEKSEIKSEKTKRIVIGCGIAFGVAAICAVGLLVWYVRKPLYSKLPMMSKRITLDQIAPY